MIQNRKRIALTDVFVSPLGLGTVKFGRNEGVKYPHRFQIPDDKTAANLLSLAKSLGINLVDTAPAYGNSEERLGNLLSGQRRDWVICTKVGEDFINGQSHFNFAPEYMKKSIIRSLKRLKTDFLDLVLVHSNGDDKNIIRRFGALEALADLKKEGLLKAFGMSTKTVEGGILAAKTSDVVMATYNLEYKDEEPVLTYCRDHDKAVFIKKAFSSGHICQHDGDPVDESFKFIFSHQGVTSVIMGTINPTHLIENVSKLEKIVTS